MKQLNNPQIFPGFKNIIWPFITSLSLSYYAYVNLFQRHFFSWRYLIYCVVLFIGFFIFFGWINTNFLIKKLKSLNNQIKISLLIFTILFSVVFLINQPLSPLYYVLPDSDFEINFNIENDAKNSESVDLYWINTGQGFVHHSDMEIDGKWNYVDNVLIFEPGQEVNISWTGKAGSNSEIVFQSTTYNQEIQIIWNGEELDSNLIGDSSEKKIYSFDTPLPMAHKILYSLSFLIMFPYITILLIVFINEIKPGSRDIQATKSSAWLLYMLPMVIVWTFSLLVFWPGVFSNDSLHHWDQAVTGNFNDWQSAIYAVVLFLLIRIKYSLSFVLILRILYFSYIVAYGLRLLERKGLPKYLLWLICIIFSISPLNNMQVITLWRDIPYAISFLWLTFLMIEIYDSDGKWIRDKKNIFILILDTLIISLLRMNGIPTVAASLFLLAVFYRKEWKRFLAVLIIMLIALLLIKGPVYSLVGVDRSKSGQSNQILLHHIAAHVDAGTRITERERDYLNNLRPIAEWEYQCCYVGPIFHGNSIDKDLLLSNTLYNLKLTINLFLRDPMVDIRHLFCAGEHAWRFGEKQCEIFSTHGFNSWYAGEQDWVIPNDYGIIQASAFPKIVQPYSDLLRRFGFLDENLTPCLQPAFYFYLTILCLFFAYFRNKDWKIFLIGMPLIIHTVILFLINPFPVFRYFYCNHLVGVFLIGLIFYKKNNNERKFTAE